MPIASRSVVIEIVVGVMTVRIPPGIDAATLQMVLRAVQAATCRPGKDFHPANRLGLRFRQKLSVRHVSNPRDSGRTLAHQHAPLKMRLKDRLRLHTIWPLSFAL
jgi:hypothetical protein